MYTWPRTLSTWCARTILSKNMAISWMMMLHCIATVPQKVSCYLVVQLSFHDVVPVLEQASQAQEHEERVPVAKLGRWRKSIAIDGQGGVGLAVANPVKRVAGTVGSVRLGLLARRRSLFSFFFRAFLLAPLLLVIFGQGVELSQVGQSFALRRAAHLVLPLLLLNTFGGS